MQKRSGNWRKLFTQKHSNKMCRMGIFIFGGLIIITSIFFSIQYGAVGITNQKVFDIVIYHLFDGGIPYWNKTEDLIIWELRFPRTLLALSAGAGLAIAGVAMQAAVKNPLADPYILGISAGASAGATAVIAAGILDITQTYSISIGAFGGALLSACILFMLNRSDRDGVRLLLSGCVISILFSSISSILLFFSKDKDKISSVLFWLMGSAADANWHMIPIIAMPVVVGLIILLIYYRQLNAMLLGSETAHTLGVNIAGLRWQLVCVVSLLVGVIVAFCGMIGFIGFVIPHIVRAIWGADHKLVLPISAFIGAIFLLWCDVLARSIVVPEEMPIGIVTALLGAPFFIYILTKQKYSFGGEK